MTLYKSFIRPHLDYGGTMHALPSLVQQEERLKKRLYDELGLLEIRPLGLVEETLVIFTKLELTVNNSPNHIFKVYPASNTTY